MMRRTVPAISCVLCFFAGIFSAGCITLYQQSTIKPPTQSRIGVMMTDSTAGELKFTNEKNYINDVLMRKGMVPVAISDINAGNLVTQSALWTQLAQGTVPAADVLKSDPVLFSSLQEHFKSNNVEYVLIVYASARALDRNLRATLVRVEDMSVVGVKFLKYRIMVPMCIGLTFALGASMFVCPWMFLKDPDKLVYSEITRMVDELM